MGTPPASSARASPSTVAASFVSVYYRVICNAPQRLAELYGPSSTLHHGDALIARGQHAIAQIAPRTPLAAARNLAHIAALTVHQTGGGGYVVVVLGSVGNHPGKSPEDDGNGNGNGDGEGDVEGKGKVKSERKGEAEAEASDEAEGQGQGGMFSQTFVLEKQTDSHEDHFFCSKDVFVAVGAAALNNDAPAAVKPPVLHGKEADEEEMVAGKQEEAVEQVGKAYEEGAGAGEDQVVPAAEEVPVRHKQVEGEAVGAMKDKEAGGGSKMEARDLLLNQVKASVPEAGGMENGLAEGGDVPPDVGAMAQDGVRKKGKAKAEVPLSPTSAIPNGGVSEGHKDDGHEGEDEHKDEPKDKDEHEHDHEHAHELGHEHAQDEAEGDGGEVAAAAQPPMKKTWASIVSSKEENAARVGESVGEKKGAGGAMAQVSKQTVEDATTQPPVNDQVENIPPLVEAEVSVKSAAPGSNAGVRPVSAGMANGHRATHMGSRGSHQRVFGPSAVVLLGALGTARLQDPKGLAHELRNEFGQYGYKVKNVEVKALKGIAFVEYESFEGVRAAVAAWSGGPRADGMFAGVSLNVSEKRPYNPKWRPGSMRGGRGGPRGGRRNRPTSTPLS